MPIKADDYKEKYEARKKVIFNECVKIIDEFLSDSSRISSCSDVKIPIKYGYIIEALIEKSFRNIRVLTGMGTDIAFELEELYCKYGWSAVDIVPSDIRTSYFQLEMDYESK